MKRRTALILALGFALALTPAAAAKDLTRAEVCGQSGCAGLPRDKNGDGLIQLRGSEGRQVVAAPKPAPYYALVWEYAPPGDVPVRNATLYVPSANLVAAPGMNSGSVEWFGASEAVLDKVRNASRGLEAYAAPKQWPTTISPPSVSPATPTQGSDGRDWTRWALVAALALGVMAIFFALARRLRFRRLGPIELR